MEAITDTSLSHPFPMASQPPSLVPNSLKALVYLAPSGLSCGMLDLCATQTHWLQCTRLSCPLACGRLTTWGLNLHPPHCKANS